MLYITELYKLYELTKTHKQQYIIQIHVQNNSNKTHTNTPHITHNNTHINILN